MAPGVSIDRVEDDALRAEADALTQWMIASAFPLWTNAGVHSSGLTWEALDFEGQPVQSPIVRVRVVARQLFVFALAHRMGWEQERCLTLIRAHFAVLQKIREQNAGRIGKLFNLESGDLTGGGYSLYDTAFALLAFAVAREVLGAQWVDAEILSVLRTLDAEFAHPDGGFFEQSEESGDRLQNPHMHLFESLLALRDAGYAGR